MKQIILIFTFLVTIFSIHSQDLPPISDSARFSILTCSPGEEVYSKFGHTGLRVTDMTTNVDLVFNYGIFDFNTDNFILKFVAGETDYLLGVYPTDSFLAEYALENRIVGEQVLNLTVAEKRKLYHALKVNYLPENKVYRYNFVFDNCATRPFLKTMESIDGVINFDEMGENKSFRTWISEYTGEFSWTQFGIDLIFGQDADQCPSQKESIFLPDVLASELQTATIISKSGGTRKMVSEHSNLVAKQPTDDHPNDALISPLFLNILILVLGILVTIYGGKFRKARKVFDCTVYALSAFIGILILLLMSFSSHPLLGHNYNLLWLNPLNLIPAIIMWNKNLRKVLFFYHIFNIVLLTSALVVLALSIQVFNIATLPLVLMLMLRTVKAIDRGRQKLFKRHVLNKKRW